MHTYWSMGNRGYLPLIILLALSWHTSCQRSGTEGAPKAGAPIANDQQTAVASGGAASPTDLPSGARGPMVESALVEPTDTIYVVVAGRAATKDAIEHIYRTVTTVPAVPVGYPALEQSVSLLGAGEGTLVLAGKYLTAEHAAGLRDALEKAGVAAAEVVTVPYRHDRYRPARNDTSGAKVAVVFAGMAGVEVPLFSQPSLTAPGSGQALPDGALVKVLSRVEVDRQVWFLVEGGYLPAARLLIHYNVFPDATGRYAVYGIELDCLQGQCGWDYWLVNRTLSQRHLLAGNAERLTHAFSPDSRWLAFAVPPGQSMQLTRCGQAAVFNLGPGISPSWTAGGSMVIFRRPGRSGQRDAVVVAEGPDWRVRTILDLEGTPAYPDTIAAYPPSVEAGSTKDTMVTAFYRPIVKDGRMSIERHLVEFTVAGVILKRNIEPLTQ